MKKYGPAQLTIMLAIAVTIGLTGAKCGTGPSGDNNERPKCGVQEDGTKDCVIQKGEQRFGGGA